ncbi:MAG: sigma-70 family RNA polymerase sigma factor [Solirubrobacterales bacterium]
MDQLLRTQRNRLLQQARFHSRRPEDAEDALSDACVQFLRFYDGPDETDALRWMMVVVKRCAWAIGRRIKTREARHEVVDTERFDEELAVVVREERSGPAELAERSEETARMIEMIDHLKPDERTALILFGLGCSYAEISEVRGWSMTKVNRCISEGRARLRKLQKEGVS